MKQYYRYTKKRETSSNALEGAGKLVRSGGSSFSGPMIIFRYICMVLKNYTSVVRLYHHTMARTLFSRCWWVYVAAQALDVLLPWPSSLKHLSLKSKVELLKDKGVCYSSGNCSPIYTGLQKITETPVLAGRKY